MLLVVIQQELGFNCCNQRKEHSDYSNASRDSSKSYNKPEHGRKVTLRIKQEMKKGFLIFVVFGLHTLGLTSC